VLKWFRGWRRSSRSGPAFCSWNVQFLLFQFEVWVSCQWYVPHDLPGTSAVSRSIRRVTIGRKPGLAPDCRLLWQRFPVDVGDPVDHGCIKFVEIPSPACCLQRNVTVFGFGISELVAEPVLGLMSFRKFTPAAMCKLCSGIAP